MQQYIFPIQSAIFMFPFLAALFTLPFLLVQYHRYGAVPIIRAVVVYSFILYLLCSYFLVILPLPDIEQVAKRTDPYINLYPYKIILSFWKNRQLNPFSLDSWKVFYHTKIWQESALNLLMTIPFGVYLRYYFRRKWWQSIFLGFGLSLFFELTQLTGLYGIYPRPYRLFDTTDLINNTVGTLLGFWITPLLVFFLPSKQKLEEVAYRKGAQISVLRRAMAFLVDWSVVGICLVGSLFAGWLAPFWLCGPLYFALLPACTKGYTIGSYLCSFRIVDRQQNPPSFWRCMLRAGVLYLPFSSAVSLWVLEAKLRGRVPKWTLDAVVELGNIMEFLSMVALIALVGQSIIKLFWKERRYYYELISGTHLISTVSAPESQKTEQNNGEDTKKTTPEAPSKGTDDNQTRWVYSVKNEQE